MLSLPVTRTFYACMGTADTTVDCWLLTYIHGHIRQAIVQCWHIYMYTADMYCWLLACVHGHSRWKATVDCWHTYMNTADMLLLTADTCTWAQPMTGYCWLLMGMYSTSREAKYGMIRIILVYFKVAQPCCVIKYKEYFSQSAQHYKHNSTCLAKGIRPDYKNT